MSPRVPGPDSSDGEPAKLGNVVIFPFYDSAPKEAVTSCNCCGSKRYALVATQDRYGLDVPTAKCRDCGLVFLSYRMTPEAYREFYKGGHYRALLAQFYKDRALGSAVEPNDSPYACAVSGFLGPFMQNARGGLLLDLGGSTGLLADKLAHDYNLDATVVEASPDEAWRAHARGLATAMVPIEEYANGGNHYDLITLCRTIDHLVDIRAVLDKVRGWLAPKGLFFVDYVVKPQIKIDHPFLLSRPVMWRYLESSGFGVRVEAMTSTKDRALMLCEGV